MKRFLIVISLILNLLMGCTNDKPVSRYFKGKLLGNNILQIIPDKEYKNSYYDPIDDTTNYKLIIDDIYKDTAEKFYVRAIHSEINANYDFDLEYYEPLADIIDFDIKSYKHLEDDYFTTNDKIYHWEGNSDGRYVKEITGLTPETFNLAKADSIEVEMNK